MPTTTPLLLLALFAQDDPLPDPDPAITAAELRHHVAFLASDELQGRRAGTPDAVRAANYLARALEAAGLAPAGDAGTFLQAVPLERWVHHDLPQLRVELMSGERIQGELGVDFTAFFVGAPVSTGDLELATVRSAEELPDEPSREVALFVDGSLREQRDWMRERGMDGNGWGLRVRLGSTRPGSPADPPRSRLARSAVGTDTSSAVVTLRGRLAEALAAGEVATLALTCFAEREEVLDYNVVARLDGVGTPERPELAGETIVLSAHYDHIGVRSSSGDDGEDLVYNGADDDASGVAAVLEVAQALAARGAPARTVVVLMAAGEEQGLLGTLHYLDHPVVPLEETVANLNFEMVGRPDEAAGGAGRLWLTGFERTTLGPAFQEAGFLLVPDPHPEQNFFQRSDNYAFALRGIVAQTLSSYDLHEDYHRVTDEVDTLDFDHMEAAVRAALSGSVLLTDGRLTPDWLPGGQPTSRR